MFKDSAIGYFRMSLVPDKQQRDVPTLLHDDNQTVDPYIIFAASFEVMVGCLPLHFIPIAVTCTYDKRQEIIRRQHDAASERGFLFIDY